jgi:hypothetical protein
MLDQEHEISINDKKVYALGRIGEYNVVFACSPKRPNRRSGRSVSEFPEIPMIPHIPIDNIPYVNAI